MLLHKKHGFQYIRHGNWSFFINFAQSNTIKTLYIMYYGYKEIGIYDIGSYSKPMS